jgi:hypothetical protein
MTGSNSDDLVKKLRSFWDDNNLPPDSAQYFACQRAHCLMLAAANEIEFLRRRAGAVSGGEDAGMIKRLAKRYANAQEID